METIRNIHFTRLIRVKGRLHEFNFRKRGSHRYDADVSDEWGSRHFFTLLQENENWRIYEPVIEPWIRGAEEDIINSITSHE